MTAITKNLGLVKAIHEGVNPPINIKMLWYNTNPGEFRHYYYDTILLLWRPLGSGTTVIFKLENINTDTAFIIPAGYTIFNCVIRFSDIDMTLSIPDISMGTNVDADNMMPVQPAVVDKMEDNTIFINYSQRLTATVTIKAQTWIGMGACSFYFTFNKYY